MMQIAILIGFTAFIIGSFFGAFFGFPFGMIGCSL